jgi:hypothetical protein
MGPGRERATHRFQTAADGQPPTAEQRAKVKVLTELVVDLAAAIDHTVPEGRNKSLALTALEDVHMRSNRGIFMDGDAS